MSGFTIGKVAKKAGVGIETIRFYERTGLIEPPPRKESGYRQYPENTIARLFFIRRAKELGFTLKEIKDLLYLRYESTVSCSDIKRRAETKIADIAGKIADLEKIKTVLTQLTAECSGRGPVSECPILEALEPEKDGNEG